MWLCTYTRYLQSVHCTEYKIKRMLVVNDVCIMEKVVKEIVERKIIRQ